MLLFNNNFYIYKMIKFNPSFEHQGAAKIEADEALYKAIQELPLGQSLKVGVTKSGIKNLAERPFMVILLTDRPAEGDVIHVMFGGETTKVRVKQIHPDSGDIDIEKVED